MLTIVESGLSGSRSPDEEKDEAHISHSVAEIRDVFGDSDDEDAGEYAIRNDIDQDSNVSLDVSRQLNFIFLYLLVL